MAEKTTTTKRVLGFGGEKPSILSQHADDYASRQDIDPFTTFYSAEGAYSVIEPPFSPYALKKLPYQNNTLLQCIDVYVTNIEGFGHTFDYVGPEGEEETEEALAELQYAEELMNMFNDSEDVTEVKKKIRRDRETFGYGYLEVTNPDGDGVVAGYHVPSQTMRMTKADDYYTEYESFVSRGGEIVSQKFQRRFRRFVQVTPKDATLTYFKECGDPRRISSRTGEEIEEGADEEEASEVIYFGDYSPGESYGLPRWINQLPAVLGSRKSEETNLSFFEDNAIPAMAILVGGGQLSMESIEAIKDQFTLNKGSASQHKVMVLEAVPDQETMDMAEGRPAAPSIKIEALSKERDGDSLFQNYDKSNSTKIQSSFRLPSILLGLSEDYTRATAQSSLDMAESQIFVPERKAFDRIANYKILLRKRRPMKYWRFRSKPAKISGSSAIIESLTELNEVGALTPNIARSLANGAFDTEFPNITEDWGDLPYSAGSIESPNNSTPPTDTPTE